ncbi:hypothetical protein QEZ52_00415 [Aliisedimentitalea scapharcae]|uniref:Uncharacterized protein n=1 Tax=Aliisedimentitalea scapharcae TaxID=1524259 RepID=A0ABZ2XUJ9_9RHOB
MFKILNSVAVPEFPEFPDADQSFYGKIRETSQEGWGKRRLNRFKKSQTGKTLQLHATRGWKVA